MIDFPEYHLSADSEQDGCWQAEFEILLSEDLVYFDGHFEQVAILPAVAQLHLAKQLFFRHYQASEKLAFGGMKQVKFVSPIQPDGNLSLSLQYVSAERCLTFVYTQHEQTKSKGRIQFINREQAK